MSKAAIISPLVARLCKLNKANQLKCLARLSGTRYSGGKAAVAGDLLAMSKMRSSVQPNRVLSIDLGIVNIGACLLQTREHNKPLIEQCFRTFIPNHGTLEWQSPVGLATSIEKFVDSLLDQTHPDCILIETQRTNSGFSRVSNIILRLSRLEASIHMAIRAKAPSVYVETPLPRRIVDFWRDSSAGAELSERGYKNAKLLRTMLVQQWLSRNELNRPFEIADSLVESMALEQKRDDMSDALAQGMAWLFWRQTGVDLLELLSEDPLINDCAPLFESSRKRLSSLV